MQIIPNGILILDIKTKKISFANEDMLKLAEVGGTDEEENERLQSLRHSIMNQFFQKDGASLAKAEELVQSQKSDYTHPNSSHSAVDH